MDVFEFEKCLLTRMEESRDILSLRDDSIQVSRIRSEWAYYIELQIEPTGWHALWKIPRVLCEELKIKYPTCVLGTVENVLFKELKAIFSVVAVDDDDIQIPEQHEVNLIDLWPTKKQDNNELNTEGTADCIDRLRFFYTHIWMPWDNDCDDDVNWTEKRIESRIKFYYDLKRKDMKRALAAHIRTLLTEARYIQSRREYLEIGLSDDEEMDDTLDKSQITDLMRLHLRLVIIKSEMEILENPEMRKLYEEVKFDNEKFVKHALKPEKKLRYSGGFEKTRVYIVTKPYRFREQMKYLEVANQFINDDTVVQMSPSLQDVLDVCNASDEIYLPPGAHFIKFLEYLNNNGIICGLTPEIMYNTKEKWNTDPNGSDVIIMSQDEDSILMIFDGDFKIENVTLDCRNTRSGLLVKNGDIYLKNCRIIGDGESTTRQGIIVSGTSKLFLDNCIVQNFATGICLQDKAEIHMINSTIFRCGIGLSMDDDNKLNFKGCLISSSTKYGICFATNCLDNKFEQKKLIYKSLEELGTDLCELFVWTGSCTMEDAKLGNVMVYNKQFSLFSPRVQGVLADSLENDIPMVVGSA